MTIAHSSVGTLPALLVFLIVLASTPKSRADNAAAENIAEQRAAEEFFETHVRPLLIEHCYECHSVEAGESSGGLRLDDATAVLRGGLGGASIVPGKSADSLLIRAIDYNDSNLQMPPEGKLDEAQIAILKQWVDSGAYDPRKSSTVDASPTPLDPSQHWAFQLPELTPAPNHVDVSSRDVVDAVVAERILQENLQPAGEARPEVLLRRLAFDLTGLPPDDRAAQLFLNSSRPDAYERLVDHFMAAPEFGERWARHWMDVARYADTVGYALGGKERRLIGSERYRDWLIREFNRDLPYDAMVRYQLAADYFDPEGTGGHLDAMGFLSVGRRFLNRHDILDDQIDVVSRGLLGITVACARCHDHKFDPVPTTDYYALFGIFNSSKYDTAEDTQWPLRIVDADKVSDAVVFVRGQPGNRGPRVARAFLSVLEEGKPEPFTLGSGRKELAERIADIENPLTARVFVNRVWQHLVGRPLVDTPSDFGVRTSQPVHPTLLDDLAVDFVNHQWSVKHLVRRIVTSHIYRQDSFASASQMEFDPENRWLARANRGRLDFEALRDASLLVSNRLDRTIGGPPVSILDDPTPPRRTVYAFIDRQQLPGVFRVFDLASPDAHTPTRYFTTVPQQALFLLNSPFAMQAACEIVEEVQSHDAAGRTEDEAFVRALFERVLQRKPQGPELTAAMEFLALPTVEPEAVFNPKQQWQYGAGRVNEAGLVKEFVPFPSFVNGRYQGSDTFPDPTWSYTSITANGGHPGSGNQWTAVRRWTSNRDGKVIVSGYIDHPSDKGDGVRLTIVADESSLVRATAFSKREKLERKEFRVRSGQNIDVVVDDNGTTSFDSFTSKVKLRFIGDDGQRFDFDTESDFEGPGPTGKRMTPLDRRQQLAQVLLLSNEFLFVD